MIIDKTFARELAADLLKINAVLLRPNQPFDWSSGWKAPIYCDNRLTLSHPAIRSAIASNFATKIEAVEADVDVITGTATAGIPHAAWVSAKMDKPMAYVRTKAKSHGTKNQIEGGVKKGESTVIVEDLISTGGSALAVVDALEFVGAEVKGIFAIFTYGFDVANEKFAERNIPVYTLTDYPTLVQVALESGYVSESDMELLAEWRTSPSTWPPA